MKTRHALLIGTSLAIVYDIVQAALSYRNPFLFWIGVFCIFITFIGLLVNLPDEDDFNLKWMLMYVIPAGLLTASLVLRKGELENSIITQFGYEAIPSVLPGHSSEYEGSAHAMYFSFTIPIQVLVINAFYCGIKLAYEAVKNKDA